MSKRARRLSARAGASARHSEPSINLNESPLAWLARRKDKDGRPMLSDAEVSAGERLRADFWFAQMTPNVTTNWSSLLSEGGRRHGGPDHGLVMSDRVIAARERVRVALATVGPELAGMLIDVCCHLKGLEAAERNGGFPQRSGKVVLDIALKALARHYGFINADGHRHGSRAKPSHWGTPDYRPRVSCENDEDDQYA
jgi:hypothetical protein